MAGTLTISTLSDGTNSTSSTNCIQGSAKAWVNFNGSTAGIRASYNVSSITKNATGDYSVNFTTALSDTNYSALLSGITDVGGGGRFVNGPYTSTPATTSFRFYCSQTSVGSVDFVYAYAAFFR